jgi:hypothetical protein
MANSGIVIRAIMPRIQKKASMRVPPSIDWYGYMIPNAQRFVN